MQVKTGAEYLGGNRCSFTVWAPVSKNVMVQFAGPARKQVTALDRIDFGYWHKKNRRDSSRLSDCSKVKSSLENLVLHNT